MKNLNSISLCLFSVLVAVSLSLSTVAPAAAQDYWEHEPFEGEWERHFPTRGAEVEHEDDGDIEVEAEQYEYEPGEGYHEQEWYDPSDWFETGRDVDYEYDRYEYDRYDDYGTYDYYTDDWYDNEPVFDRWYWWP